MYRFIWLVLAFLTFPIVAQAQPNAWINEIHYDNTGADVGEFVEIVIQDIVAHPAAGFELTLYNGNGGASYASAFISDCLEGDTVGDYVFYDCSLSGIQNGAPDGVALSEVFELKSGQLTRGFFFQFLSYEGVFMATDGPVSGFMSTDIGVAETSSTPIGESLQLTGTGTQYSDFTWAAPSAETPGAENNGQTISATSDLQVTCTPVSPPITIPAGGGSYVWNISVTNNGVASRTFDIWINIAGPGVDRTKGPISRTLAAGASLSRPLTMNVPDFAPAGAYTHTCNVGDFATTTIDDSDNFAWTKSPPDGFSPDVVLAWSTDAEIEAQLEGRANATIDIPGTHMLEAAYPNPFNPEATFRFAVNAQQNVRADLVDVLGRVVATLFEGNVAAGEVQTVRIAGTGLPSGTYVVRVVGEAFADSRRVTLLK